ncbi:RING finger protein 207-like [Liolophura sinensis]|uniref:RING finger protein 207-like n=1 Tax=Liolophura sinensis TaxID=3198878 RepID=UPI003157FD92
MSGEIIHQMDNLADFENATKRNPLLCYLCNEQFEDPRIFPCFHSFCSKCIRGHVSDGKIVCPLCGGVAQLKEDQSLPPSDSLLKFLIESSTEEKALCANCDNANGHMFFCNTCTQPLCGICREDTHKARMFASHEIVLMAKRTKDIHKLCKLHSEPYIMFSTEKKVMLCINCFRDMKIESRSYCVDLETAYKQGCKKLDQAVLAVHDLQNSVRDGILLLRVLLEEVRRNAVTEKQAIQTLYVNMQEKIQEKKTELEEEVERQYKAKESLFKAQLVTLTTLLPTIHVNLVTSAAFTGTANKHEFLDLAYSLMGRLTSIVQHQHKLYPTQSSQVNTDYKAQIAKCLEPLLFPYYQKGDNNTCTSSLPLSRPASSQSVPMPNIRLELPVTAPSTTNGPNRGVTVVSYGPNGGRRGNNNGSKVKFIDAKGVFAEHCVEFDNSHRDLLQKLEKLKSCVQELHRDLTLRRIMAKNCKVSDFKTEVAEVDEQLTKHCDHLEQKRIALEKHWEECLQRIGNEQELYQAQMSDVLRLKQECQHLKTIVTQLSPFIESISKVTERIVPKLGDYSSSSNKEKQIHALFEQINTMQPDSQQRVDAIRTAEEERETQTANRTNPLDDELIKTKGLLKAPSARRESGTRRDLKDHFKMPTISGDSKGVECSNVSCDEGRICEVTIVNACGDSKSKKTECLCVNSASSNCEAPNLNVTVNGEESTKVNSGVSVDDPTEANITVVSLVSPKTKGICKNSEISKSENDSGFERSKKEATWLNADSTESLLKNGDSTGVESPKANGDSESAELPKMMNGCKSAGLLKMTNGCKSTEAKRTNGDCTMYETCLTVMASDGM